jgi:hypothetical protein
VSNNKSVFGRSANLIAGSIYRLGPSATGPALGEKKGSVIIVLPPNRIKKVTWPIQVMVSSFSNAVKLGRTLSFGIT